MQTIMILKILKMSSAHGLCRPRPYECDTMFSAVRCRVFSGACVELPDVFQETALCRCYPVVIINSRQSHVVGPGHKRAIPCSQRYLCRASWRFPGNSTVQTLPSSHY